MFVPSVLLNVSGLGGYMKMEEPEGAIEALQNQKVCKQGSYEALLWMTQAADSYVSGLYISEVGPPFQIKLREVRIRPSSSYCISR